MIDWYDGSTHRRSSLLAGGTRRGSTLHGQLSLTSSESSSTSTTTSSERRRSSCLSDVSVRSTGSSKRSSTGDFSSELDDYFDNVQASHVHNRTLHYIKGKVSPYLITEHRVPELIPVLGSQPAGDVSHKPSSMLRLLSARPTVTLAALKWAATIFAAWWTEAWWVWTVCLRLLPDSVAVAIWTQALLRLSPAR